MDELDDGEEFGEDEMGEEGEQELFDKPQPEDGGGCSIKLDFGLDDLL